MTLGHLAYFVTIIIFAGGAILIEWLLAYKFLKRFWKIIILISILGIIVTLIGEPFALKWQAWGYNVQGIFNIFLGGAALETFLFAIFVFIAISSATLIWSDYEKNGLPLIKTTLNELKRKIINRKPDSKSPLNDHNQNM